jgi:PBP1b-binding outer membrane lipoprotein LpoB
MKTLLLITMLLAILSGCVIHEPSHQIIYTPERPLTNSQPTSVSSFPDPQFGSGATAESNRAQ